MPASGMALSFKTEMAYQDSPDKPRHKSSIKNQYTKLETLKNASPIHHQSNFQQVNTQKTGR
jgi:hypothetical protein